MSKIKLPKSKRIYLIFSAAVLISLLGFIGYRLLASHGIGPCSNNYDGPAVVSQWDGTTSTDYWNDQQYHYVTFNLDTHFNTGVDQEEKPPTLVWSSMCKAGESVGDPNQSHLIQIDASGPYSWHASAPVGVRLGIPNLGATNNTGLTGFYSEPPILPFNLGSIYRHNGRSGADPVVAGIPAGGRAAAGVDDAGRATIIREDGITNRTIWCSNFDDNRPTSILGPHPDYVDCGSSLGGSYADISQWYYNASNVLTRSLTRGDGGSWAGTNAPGAGSFFTQDNCPGVINEGAHPGHPTSINACAGNTFDWYTKFGGAGYPYLGYNNGDYTNFIGTQADGTLRSFYLEQEVKSTYAGKGGILTTLTFRYPRNPQVEITKTLNNPGTFEPGSLISFNLKVKRPGGPSLQYLRVADDISAQPISFAGTDAPYTSGPPGLIWEKTHDIVPGPLQQALDKLNSNNIREAEINFWGYIDAVVTKPSDPTCGAPSSANARRYKNTTNLRAGSWQNTGGPWPTDPNSTGFTPYNKNNPPNALVDATPSSLCYEVLLPREPFLTTAKGDVHAGCTSLGTIKGRTSGGFGSAAEYIVSAGNSIDQFGSAGNPGGNSLTFGNLPPGDGHYGLVCRPDLPKNIAAYLAKFPGRQKTVAQMSAGALVSGDVVVQNGSITIDNSVVGASLDKRFTLYVTNGDAIITQDLGYPGGTYANRAALPGFGLIANGSIKFANNVTSAAGFYSARDTIYTCTDGGGTPISVGTAGQASQCLPQLNVNGFLMANNFRFGRTGGDVRTNVPAESIILNPLLYLATPPAFEEILSLPNFLGEHPPIY